MEDFPLSGYLQHTVKAHNLLEAQRGLASALLQPLRQHEAPALWCCGRDGRGRGSANQSG